MKPRLDVVSVSQEQIEDALAQAKALLPAEPFETIEKVARAYLTLLRSLEAGKMTIRRLRRMLFGPSSEKIRDVLTLQGRSQTGTQTEGAGSGGAGKAKSAASPPPGHGRNGQADYPSAQTVSVPHHKLKPGDHCPRCKKGKVYDQRDRPGLLVRLTGQPPLSMTVFERQNLRCNLCGDGFLARPPEGVGRQKHDETASSMIGLLKYGGGFPFNRLGKLQDSLGLPLAPSTQWDIVSDAALKLEPAYDELKRQAAQGRVLHNDDTAMKILQRMGLRREAAARDRAQDAADGHGGETPKAGRTGIFTSGIVSLAAGRQIALFFTGVRHAGENLQALLDKRNRGLRPPIQMCDALSRNLPDNFKTVLANCLAHGRRRVVELLENFPGECGHILRVLAEVYKNDALAKKRKMTDIERLRFHQEHSGPLMEGLHDWMQALLADKKVEPNSGMGEAIAYLLKHWEGLTLFLRKAGAPLDNNICERALKKAILHRKNSLFYKTDNGARVGDLFMSLIHTCELNGADPFDYITQLQRHAKEVRAQPERWMPWNYPRTPARAPPA